MLGYEKEEVLGRNSASLGAGEIERVDHQASSDD